MVLEDVTRAFALFFSMLWDTWWALVLGFTITGAVETFVSEETMSAHLGGNDWEEVGLGTVLGAASSSCSFAATSTAKSLFKKGASAPASIAAYQFAATDLVAELFLVMLVLLGWQFVVGEIIGGVIAVLVIAYIWMNYVPDSVFEGAREHVLSLEDIQCAACGMSVDLDDPDTATETFHGETKHFCCAGCLSAYQHMDRNPDEERGWQEKATSVEGWKDASRNTMKEWDMLWEDIFIGFVIASLLGAFVPKTWWAQLFPAEAGFGGVVVAAVLGVVIGIVTFLCSVGNIPFAVILWTNGVPFGAIMSFIYADMIIPPLVNTYRKYYGTTMATVIFLSYAFASVVAGVVVHYVFGFAGLIPAAGETTRTISHGYTLWLNLLFTAIFLWQTSVAFGRESVEDTLVAIPGIVAAVVADLREAGGLVAEGVSEVASAFRTAFRLVERAAHDLSEGAKFLARGGRLVGSGFSAVWGALRRVGSALVVLGRRIVEAIRVVAE